MVIKTQDGCSLATFKTTLTPPTMPPPQQVILVDKTSAASAVQQVHV